MAAESYQTIFELGFRSLPLSFMGGPLFFIGISLLLIRFARHFRRKTFFIAVGVFIGSMATIMFVTLLIALIPKFLELRSAYVAGQSKVVEGVITDFHPAPMIGPAKESFVVNGVVFSYNALDVDPCFHNAPIHHGIIREGMDVRIHYNNECIQRVDAVLSNLSHPSTH
jgi:hypothetical protein